MPQKPLDYQTPIADPLAEQKRIGRVMFVAIAVLWLVANAIVVVPAVAEIDGFRAMGLAVGGGLIANGIVFVLSVALIMGVVVRYSTAGAVRICVGETFVLCLLGIVGEFSAVGFLRHLHL